MLKIYRVILDEPVGVCVGFEPKGFEFEYDLFYLNEDNGGDFVHIENGKITINKIPQGAEPDLLIWRTHEEFEAFKTEYE